MVILMEKIEIVAVIALSLVAGFIGAWAFNEYKLGNQDMLIRDYYAVENAVSVSPHGIRKELASGSTNFILVDLRSEEEYNQSHIIGAVSIPAYKDRDHSDYGSVQRIVSSFKELMQKYPDKEIITYCYSTACMTSRKIGEMLAEHGIYVKHLNIGWNEWRYFWTTWNHEHEWNSTNPEDYVEAVGEHKSVANDSGGACPVNNQFGC